MIILDHRVGEEFVTHRLQSRFGTFRIGLGELDVENLALAHAGDAGEAERGERALDCLALRIEDARFECDGDARLHMKGAFGLLHQHRPGTLRPLLLHEDAEAAGDFLIGLEQPAEVAAEAILVELVLGLDVP